jgi:hypothetical protein
VLEGTFQGCRVAIDVADDEGHGGVAGRSPAAVFAGADRLTEAANVHGAVRNDRWALAIADEVAQLAAHLVRPDAADKVGAMAAQDWHYVGKNPRVFDGDVCHFDVAAPAVTAHHSDAEKRAVVAVELAVDVKLRRHSRTPRGYPPARAQAGGGGQKSQ